jgi:hypothetical protein
VCPKEDGGEEENKLAPGSRKRTRKGGKRNFPLPSYSTYTPNK